MFLPPKRSLAALAVPLVSLLAAPAAATPAPSNAAVHAAPRVATLVDVRASHQPGLDRVVFEFRGPLPARRSAGYVSRLIADGSGRTVPVAGDAILGLRFGGATGHDNSGRPTYGPARETFALPGVIQVVNAGDFEAELTFGVGLSSKASYRVYTLTHPSRVVVDIKTPYRTVPVRTYFLDSRAYAAGRRPYTASVSRPVAPPSTARGALQRLFAGPTQAEYAKGLRFVASGATGVGSVVVRDGVAHVRLTGSLGSGGSAFTVADEITPTLKRLPGIRWVKIYDAHGRTERPKGHSDSVPESLEP
ncbi:GerMN domain-containing protein [Microbispora sp. KK1-11]|uniref:GerMN domain-containing protein n=1 Tax=Microbispora sp. KK1-11 TaxID=2053005 RepID=UPI0011571274|nr:GerMN domain-containing protein [Microbispora sp. KK1-11]TQS28002.1 GerMN domain-containing protein [Microbispora sp. KK1-11]